MGIHHLYEAGCPSCPQLVHLRWVLAPSFIIWQLPGSWDPAHFTYLNCRWQFLLAWPSIWHFLYWNMLGLRRCSHLTFWYAMFLTLKRSFVLLLCDSCSRWWKFLCCALLVMNLEIFRISTSANFRSNISCLTSLMLNSPRTPFSSIEMDLWFLGV